MRRSTVPSWYLALLEWRKCVDYRGCGKHNPTCFPESRPKLVSFRYRSSASQGFDWSAYLTADSPLKLNNKRSLLDLKMLFATTMR